MKYLADTDFLVDLYRGSQRAISKLKELKTKQTIISTSTITAAELYEGAYKSRNVSASIVKVEALLNSFHVILLEPNFRGTAS